MVHNLTAVHHGFFRWISTAILVYDIALPLSSIFSHFPGFTAGKAGKKDKTKAQAIACAFVCDGVYLSSQAVASQVFSTQVSLTSVFGMGTGGSSPPSTPSIFSYHFWYPENWINLTPKAENLACSIYQISWSWGQALDRLVLAGLTRRRAYTLSLSTS